jgi:AraC-like DNA-binding protein
VGVSPKQFARIVRFQRALRVAKHGASWSTVATEAGYYDQAHLIAEFRELAGTTPAAFLRAGGP